MTVPPTTTFATRPPTRTRSQGLDLGFVFRHYGAAYRAKHRMPLQHWKAMIAIESCRTAVLGGHVQECGDCGAEQISYNSCRNRHCPKCQTLEKEQWLEARHQELLPIRYFQVVFTLPEQLRPLAWRNQKVVYNILFRAASDTLLKFGRDPKRWGGELGFIAVLHTWSQTLIDHPHLHCIVTGGGLSLDGQRWIRSHPNYLFPVQAVAEVFQGKFLEALREAYDANTLDLSGQLWPWRDRTAFKNLLSKLYSRHWNADIRSSFDQPQHVIDYLARYTHRVALTNDRIVKLENDQVNFSWLDRQDGNKRKLMTLPVAEFIRRFLLHILPEKFVKIRHYGILSNRQRQHQLRRCRVLLSAPPPPAIPPLTWQEQFFQLTGIDPTRCRACGQGRLLYRQELLPTWCHRSAKQIASWSGQSDHFKPSSTLAASC